MVLWTWTQAKWGEKRSRAVTCTVLLVQLYDCMGGNGLAHTATCCYEASLTDLADRFRRPIRFLLRRPNRHQDRCSLRRLFPENLITCIIACIPHVTYHMQSSRDS